MAVAQLRGIRFHQDDEGYWEPGAVATHGSAYTALADVARWLGFDDDHAYCHALRDERERIFERSTDG